MKIKNTSGKTMGFTLGDRTRHLAPNATAVVDDSSPKAVADVNSYVRKGFVQIIEGNAQAMVPGDNNNTDFTNIILNLGAKASFNKDTGGRAVEDKLITIAGTVLEFDDDSAVTAGHFPVATVADEATVIANLEAAFADEDVIASLDADGVTFVSLDSSGTDVVLTLAVSPTSAVGAADVTTDIETTDLAVAAVGTPAAVANIAKKVTIASLAADSPFPVFFPVPTILAATAKHVSTDGATVTAITAAVVNNATAAPASVKVSHTGALAAGYIVVTATCVV